MDMYKAPNIFQQFAFAFVPPKYKGLAKVKTGSMIGFVTLLVLILAIASLVKLGISYVSFGGAEAILDEIPDFELENGRFSIDEPFCLDTEDTFIYITGEYSEFDYDDVKDLVNDGYNQVMLIAKKGLWMYNKGEFQELAFKDIKDLSLSKDWVMDTLVPIIWLCIAVGYLFGFVGGTLWYFACAAVYLLIAMLIALIMSKKVPAGKLFRVAVYAKVPMYVIAKVWGLLPISFISIPFLIRLVVTVVFLVLGINYVAQNDDIQPAPYYNPYDQSSSY